MLHSLKLKTKVMYKLIKHDRVVLEDAHDVIRVTIRAELHGLITLNTPRIPARIRECTRNAEHFLGRQRPETFRNPARNTL